MKLSYRATSFMLFLFCLAILTTTLYLQYADQIQPCLLCFMQRVFYIVISFVLLISTLHHHNRLSIFFYNALLIILSVLGLITALRQVWLQHLPSDAPSTCLPNAAYLFKTLPLHKALQLTYAGTAECAQIHWTFFRLTMADWSAICLFLILVVIIWQFRYLKRSAR